MSDEQGVMNEEVKCREADSGAGLMRRSLPLAMVIVISNNYRPFLY